MFAFNLKFLHVAVWSLQRHWHGSEHLGHISKSKRQTSWKSLLWSPETLWKSWKSWEFMKTNGWIWLIEEWQLWLPSYTCNAVLNLDSAQFFFQIQGAEPSRIAMPHHWGWSNFRTVYICPLVQSKLNHCLIPRRQGSMSSSDSGGCHQNPNLCCHWTDLLKESTLL